MPRRWMDLVWTWHTGPDAGGTHPLPPGRSVIGRGGRITCDDPHLLAHHALVEIGPDGPVLTQLCGSSPLVVDGRPIDGPTRLGPDAVVAIAGSTATVDQASSPSTPAVMDEAGRVMRTPRRPPPAPTPPPASGPDGPPELERPGGLVPALVGLTGAAVMAVVLAQPMFLLVGVLGASVGVTSWVSQWLTYRRRHRRALTAYRQRVDDHTRALAAATAAHVERCRQTAPGIIAARRAAAGPTTDLWSRRPGHDDAHLVAVGLADPVVNGLAVERVPVPVDLGPRARVACTGPTAAALARSALCQLITQCGPADVRLVIATHRPDHWHWVDDAPHARSVDGSSTVVDPSVVDRIVDALADVDPTIHLVVICDDTADLTDRTSPLRRVVDSRAVALLAVLADNAPPHVCSTVVDTATGSIGNDLDGVRVAGLSERSARTITRALTRLVDPEDRVAVAAGLPRDVELADLVGPVTAAAIRTAWLAPPPGASTPIGRTADRIAAIDLVADGPHALVAGTTGSGKSELLRSLVLGLAVRYPADTVSFVLVDFKGGATFDRCAELPHVVGVVTDLDDDLADRVLRSLHAELRRREGVLRAAGASDIAGLIDGTARPPLARLVVVVDEFAALVAERPGFLHALVDVARRGRSLGLHLILATQRPAGVISDDIRANASLRIALRLHDAADAIDVVGDRLPTTFPRSVPGRALIGRDDPLVVQTAHCARPGEIVDVVRAAHLAAGHTTPAPPWRPPLPEVLDHRTARRLVPSVDHDIVGVLDDPDRQRTLPLVWHPDDGALLVAGADRSAVTAAALAVVASIAPRHTVHVIDGTDDRRWDDWAHHPAVDVVRPSDDGRLVRLLHGLSTPDTDAVIVVDGLDRLRRVLDIDASDHRPGHRHDTRADHLTAAVGALLGAAGRIVVTTSAAQGVPNAWLAALRHRWVLHVADAQEAAAVGLPPSLVPPPIAGRVRVGALVGQLVTPHPPATTPTCPRIARTPGTPTSVDAARLGAAVTIGRATRVAIGLDVTNGNEVTVDIGAGDRVLVLGAPSTGRTTTLRLLATRLDGLVPVHVVDDAELADPPEVVGATLLVAARVDGLGGRFGHWVDELRHTRTTIVLAASDTSLEAEYLGRVLPRGFPVRPRPGVAWVVDGASVTPTQLAVVART